MSSDELAENVPQVLPEGDGLLEFILDNGPNLFFIKDDESRILYANKAFLAIYPPDRRADIVGSTTVENFTSEEADLFLSEDRRAFLEGHSEIVEEITDWRARRVTLLSRKIVFQTSDGEKRLVCISTDITQLAARERHLVRLNAQLKVYSHSIAHDLKNPIASFLSGLALIERDKSTVLGERAQSIIEALRDSATGLSNSISSMLIAASGDENDLKFRKYDLNILLEEVRFNLASAIEKAGLNLNVTRLPSAIVEPDLLRQLFQNLIENSIKHAATDRPMVTIHHKKEEGEHVFYVGDNGKGIPKEKKDLVFGQFFKSGHNEGLGLGLTICQRIANLHDGFIEIHDRVERGCCMVVRIPAR